MLPCLPKDELMNIISDNSIKRLRRDKMLTMPRLFLGILVSVFLFSGIAWSQQGSFKTRRQPEEIKEINKDFSKERPLKDEREKSLLDNKEKTPARLIQDQENRAAESSTTKKKKGISRVSDRNKKNAKKLSYGSDSPSHSGLPIEFNSGESKQQKEPANFIEAYYTQKPKRSEEKAETKETPGAPIFGGKALPIEGKTNMVK